jgi:hypothetical protein
VEDTEEEEEEEEEKEEEKEEEEIRVPLFIILGVFYGFLIGGGFAYHYLEEWPVINSSYFTYVTMSTMGFGDYGIFLINLKKRNVKILSSKSNSKIFLHYKK